MPNTCVVDATKDYVIFEAALDGFGEHARIDWSAAFPFPPGGDADLVANMFGQYIKPDSQPDLGLMKKLNSVAGSLMQNPARRSEAREHLVRARRILGDWRREDVALLYNNLAVCCALQADLPAARSNFGEAQFALDHYRIDAFRNRGNLLRDFRKKDKDEQRKTYRQLNIERHWMEMKWGLFWIDAAVAVNLNLARCFPEEVESANEAVKALTALSSEFRQWESENKHK